MRHALRRSIAVLAALVFLGLPCRAQQQTEQPDTLIRLSVAPAAAPKPALRYLLLPELKEINPGNPIQNYLKCALEEYHFLLRQGGVRSAREAAGNAASSPSDHRPARVRSVCAHPPRQGCAARQSRLADPAQVESRWDQYASARRAADAKPLPSAQRATEERDRDR